MLAVNESRTERTFNDRYGTGQSALDGILRATNLLLAGRTLVLLGYGATGRGIAQRARGAGAAVIVCEVDPLRALEARMEGFEVMPALEAAERGDLFVTVTGSRGVLRREHFERMKDGAVLANAGHFDVEIDLAALRELAAGGVREVLPLVRAVRPGRRSPAEPAGQRARGQPRRRPGPPAGGDGHELRQPGAGGRAPRRCTAPSSSTRVLDVPQEIDEEIARLKLESLGVEIDALTRRAARLPRVLGLVGHEPRFAPTPDVHSPPVDTHRSGPGQPGPSRTASRLTTGEMIAGVGAAALLLLMFLPWYGVEVNVSGFSASESGNAWETLEFIDILLFLLAVTTLGVVGGPAARLDAG